MHLGLAGSALTLTKICLARKAASQKLGGFFQRLHLKNLGDFLHWPSLQWLKLPKTLVVGYGIRMNQVNMVMFVERNAVPLFTGVVHRM